MSASKRNTSTEDSNEAPNSKKLHMENSCCCRLILDQQEEIRVLKEKLQKYEASDAPEEDSVREKLKNLGEIVEKIQKQSASTFAIESLHNKMDKLIRLMSTTAETQAKLSKFLEDSSKSNSPKPPAGSIAGTLKHLQKREAKKKEREKEENDEEESQNLTELRDRQKSLNDPTTEFKWANNTLLIGDELWHSFHTVDDVHVIIRKLEKELNFKIIWKENEVLSHLYDSIRDKLLFALPQRIFRVVISVGSFELRTCKSLLTLRQASLEEVKSKNEPLLKEKASVLKHMVLKLLSSNKQVILVIPPVGTQKVEIFRQFEDIVISELEEITTPTFKILNLPELIRSTLPDFKTQEDHLTTWFSNLATTKLSPYGTRRLFDALRRTVLLRNKKMIETRTFALDIENPFCPRCARNHSGGPSSCRSIDRICRQCGLVGHFVDVHLVTDAYLRKQIVSELGIDIFKNVSGCQPDPAPE